jgi:hypothetical protein
VRARGNQKSQTRTAAGALLLIVGLLAAIPQGAKAEGGVEGPPRMLPRPKTVSIPSILARGPLKPLAPAAGKLARSLGVLQAGPDLGGDNANFAKLGGAAARGARVVAGRGMSHGFPGIDLVTQESAGTGKYAGTGGGLEPPDQALCVGNGYVVEGVNQAFQIFNTRGVSLSKPILLAQFFGELPNQQIGPSSFLSDPRCLYDAATKRFFATTLEVDTVSGGVFRRAHNLIAVSKTSNPMKDWYVYRFDVNDDGLMGTPFHATCPCFGDQPLIGADANGFYMSTNEYSDLEILPIQPPPAVFPIINKAFALPGVRNGQAQVYALSKRALVRGLSGPIVQFDTASIPLPSDAPSGSVWSTLQPAFQPPGDGTGMPRGGVEYFLSQLDFATTGDNRVGVWALSNTVSLNSNSPRLTLHHTIIRTLNPRDTYTYAQSADQKKGPTPLGDGCLEGLGLCSGNEAKLNANDDRMQQVMLTNGHLWSAVNTLLPPIGGQYPNPRTGIMYFDIRPSMAGGALSATMVRDGYVNVPRQNVLFPSIAASPRGPVVMSFTLSGVDYFPSAAWARLDGLTPGQAPEVHVAALGADPEDGFSGYCLQGILPNVGGQCTDEKARWGDYSASVVDEDGCIWSGTEYISGIHRDSIAGNWSTFVTRITPPGCGTQPLTPSSTIAPCKPLFTDAAGDDDYLALETNGSFRGQNPQLDILKGTMSLASDGRTLITTLTLRNLSKSPASPGGGGNDYYVVWTYKGIQYFSHANVDPSGVVTYTDGSIQGNTYADRAASDQGAFNPGPNGTIVVRVPLSAVGGAKRAQMLLSPNGQTKERVGVLLEAVDDTSPQNDYLIGQVCPA